MHLVSVKEQMELLEFLNVHPLARVSGESVANSIKHHTQRGFSAVLAIIISAFITSLALGFTSQQLARRDML